jgi:O-antigen/teichoic acid export membrane protein
MTIAFRPKRDAVLGLTAWIIPLLTNFVVTPVIVRNLGTTDYGIYTLLSGFAAYAVALAVGNAFVRFSPVIAHSPLAGCRSLLPTALCLAAASAVANCAAILFLWPWLLPRAEVGDATGFVMTCALVLVLLFNQVLIVIPQIARRYPLVTVATAVSGVLLPVGGAVVATHGDGWTGVLLWQLVVALGLLVALATSAAVLLFPQRSQRPLPWAWRLKMASLAANIGIAQMLGNGLAVTERGLLGALSGPDAVGYYVLALTITLLLRTSVVQATMMLPVIVTQAYSETSGPGLAELYCWLMRHVLAFVTFGATALVICGPALLSIWLGDGYRVEIGNALRWLAPAMALLVVSGIAWNFAEMRGATAANTVLSGFWLVSVLAMGSVLAPSLGAEGLSIARFVGMIAVPFHIAWIERRVFGGLQTNMWFASLWRLTVAALASAAALQLGASVLPAGWIGLGVDVMAGLVVFYMLLFGTKQIRLRDFTVPTAPRQRVTEL